MARTALVYHPAFLDHDSGPGHPERPDRLVALMERLEDDGLLQRCVRLTPAEASVEALERVHSRRHVEYLAELSGLGWLVAETPDTLVSPGTYRAALLAAGAAVLAVDAVLDGRADNAFCPLRPPGHHAEHDRAMGFCYINNVAVAARHLLSVRGLQRVAIVDWDVHHPNGTQHTFEDDPSVLVCSVHQFGGGFFPGTGAAAEQGRGPGVGATLNAPQGPGCTDADYLDIMRLQFAPAIDRFAPDFILVSTGFDAHRADPLGSMELSNEGFAALTRQIVDLAARHCQGRVVSVLEGGYDLEALAGSAAAHVRALLAA
jgi:acetoin utilization deacetylase AcuC-like enzyme